IPNEAREAAKNDEGSKVVCPYPENKAELTFEEEELDIVFRDWVEAISPSCSRFEADEIAVDPQEMAAIFNKYPKVRDIVVPALKKKGTAYFPMPRLYGKLMDDGRALQYSYVSDDDVLKSYNEQLQKFGELLIYESRDNLPKALTDLASLECRLTYILSARGDENQAKDYLEGSIQHYLLATDVAKETNSSDPAFVLEAGVMAKINDDLGRACTLFDRVVSEFPGSKEAVDAQMYIAVSCMRFYQTAENERIAAEEAKQEKSGAPNKGAAPVATRKLDTNAALTRLQQASNTSDPIKRSMAIYSQAMMYKAQGDYKTASDLLLKVVDAFIDQGKGPVQN
ncbi:MAG: hypothetical protein EBR10_11310, partial [Planctomycetes bacterium]|nr:hypothetical protein [Planctomycetota bacterium]